MKHASQVWKPAIQQTWKLLCRNLLCWPTSLKSMSKFVRSNESTPVVERVAELAMELGRRHLADYGAVRSRHDFTQRQLMACLILKAYLKTTYRGIIELLKISPRLREQLGLADKLPHFTALQKFSGRSQVVAIAQTMMATIGRTSAQQAAAPVNAAMDSTGLASGTASNYFRSRTGKTVRQWVKVSVMVMCGSLLPLGFTLDLGPSNDRIQVPALLTQAQAIAQPARLYADAGYDAEWIHVHCREQWGVESLIKPNGQRADGVRNGKWRKHMSPEHLKARGYGQRWAVESFFSGLKRTMGDALAARRPQQMLAEAAFKVLAYTLRR
jgi:hypothetical protein